MKKYILILIFAANALAIPQLINYQGQLTSPTGTPLDTTVAITFRIYPVLTGGTASWVETQPSVVVTDGLFQVSLGAFSALTDQFISDCWLGVTVGNNTEMTPRQQMKSVGNSYRVGTVDGATGGTITSDVSVNGKLNVGSGNTLTANNSLVAGFFNTVTGTLANTSGGSQNSSSGDYSSVSGGYANISSGAFSSVGGGAFNTSSGYRSRISGGANNVAADSGATIGGGFYNYSRTPFSTIAGGGGQSAHDSNSVTSYGGVVGGGTANIASGDNYSTVSGGLFNGASGERATIGGGYGNIASGSGCTVSGGSSNVANAVDATVGGGSGNHASDFAVVAGGEGNRATGASSSVGGGWNNLASEAYSTVAGGYNNSATGLQAFVGGGGGTQASDGNSASGSNSSIVGGWRNSATGFYSAIAGGEHNSTVGAYSAIIGGADNTASGSRSTVLGGYQNEAAGDYSCALGRNSHALHPGSFVWGDGWGTNLSTTGNDQFLIRASGGLKFYTNNTHTSGVTMAAGGNAWVVVSDSTKKRNIVLTDTKYVLDKIANLPVKNWEYESEPGGIEHVGPMAQDFWNVFHLGNDSLGIATNDADGVLFAAVKELANRLAAVEIENSNLRTRLQTLEASDKQTLLTPGK